MRADEGTREKMIAKSEPQRRAEGLTWKRKGHHFL